MKLLLLTRGVESYTTRRLAQCAVRAGHRVVVADPIASVLELSAHEPRLHVEKKLIAGVDCVVPRFGPTLNRQGLAVLRQLEKCGVATVNPSEAVARTRDKLAAIQRLLRHDLDLPATAYATRVEDVRFAIDLVGGPPVVVKALEGMQGTGVMLASTADSAVSLVETLTGMSQPVLVQAFIAEAAGRDVRVLVVDGEPVAAMRRIAAPGEFRANASLGARLEALPLGEAPVQVALRATEALGLGVAGVDLLETSEGPVLLEVNASPGFEGLEQATGVDAAAAIVSYAERLVSARP